MINFQPLVQAFNYLIHRVFRSSRWIVALVLLLASNAFAADEDIFKIWKTQVNDKGSYLHVEIHSCDNAICGTILEAYRKGDVRVEDYENTGKKIVWNMKAKGPRKWAGGKIWAPDTNKTYKSKISMKGENLKVSGCVAGGLICRSQKWTPVGN